MRSRTRKRLRCVDGGRHPHDQCIALIYERRFLEQDAGDARLDVVDQHLCEAPRAGIEGLTRERRGPEGHMLAFLDAIDEVATARVGEGAHILGELNFRVGDLGLRGVAFEVERRGLRGTVVAQRLQRGRMDVVPRSGDHGCRWGSGQMRRGKGIGRTVRPNHKSRAAWPCAESSATACLSKETNASAPSQRPS